MKATRKTFNFPSDLLIDVTFEKEGYLPDLLGEASAKFIWATCRFCGEPHRIRKGFFNKSGSACHLECKKKEQGHFCPFKDKAVRDKAGQTNLERYGSVQASSNREIAEKISKTRSSEASAAKTVETNRKRYGVDNVAQYAPHKEKAEASMMDRFGVRSAQQSPEIRKKTVATMMERYGVENQHQVEAFKDKRRDTFRNGSATPCPDIYKIDQLLAGDYFWNSLGTMPFYKLAKTYEVDCGSLVTMLAKDKYQKLLRGFYERDQRRDKLIIGELFQSWGFSPTFDEQSNSLALDVYIPEKNFAINLNSSYSHSEAVMSPKIARTMHYKQFAACRNEGITLINIFDRTWSSRASQIGSFLRAAMGVNQTRIAGRKCSVTMEAGRELIDKHHILGKTVAIQYFGLKYGSDIVGVMSASRHHRQNNGSQTLVLSRLCFAENVTVQGGASKLLAAMKDWGRSRGYDKIISWSDNSWTKGNVYKQLGFVLTDESAPDYFYWDIGSNEYVSKQSQMKSLTGCPKELTERVWCLSRGLYRLWDCGKKRWELPLS